MKGAAARCQRLLSTTRQWLLRLLTCGLDAGGVWEHACIRRHCFRSVARCRRDPSAVGGRDCRWAISPERPGCRPSHVAHSVFSFSPYQRERSTGPAGIDPIPFAFYSRLRCYDARPPPSTYHIGHSPRHSARRTVKDHAVRNAAKGSGGEKCGRFTRTNATRAASGGASETRAAAALCNHGSCCTE